MPWRIGIDVGGTFTDVVAINEETGERHVWKTASTPADPSLAFTTGIKKMLATLGVPMSEVVFVAHGTTVATNAILESKYARMGLIVTKGYRQMLECARQTVPGDFGDITWWIKPPRVVPLERVRDVAGRMTYTGEELAPLDEDAVRETAREFAAMDVNAVAISFLHSYRNAEHEQRARELVRAEHPDCYVSISSDVSREYREYERTLSTCLNTGLMPLVSSYVGRLTDRMRETDLDARLYVMKSSGGIADVQEFVTHPITAVLSGPAAGVMTTMQYASLAGHKDVITMDMGGTSTDISLIDDGRPHMLTEGQIDVFDIKTPMIELHAVGAGGGSIAWLVAGRSLRVGPQSAGATPGPVCYGKGGTEPTVTDAHLVLGRIPPFLLGGAIALDRQAACAVIEQQLAAPLGISLEEAAAGVVGMATANIAQGINVVSVKRGRDPRDYALFVFGGAGGLCACPAAESLGIDTIVVPPSPGVTAAEGLLYTDVRSDHVITEVQREDQLDLERLTDNHGNARAAVVSGLEREGFAADEIRLEGFGDMRYAGQAYELRVPIGMNGDALGDGVLHDAISGFHALHDSQFGYSYEGKQLVEMVSVGVTGLGKMPRPTLRATDEPHESWEEALVDTRPVCFSASDGYVDCPIYERTRSPRNIAIAGPAIVQQYDSTTVIDPGWHASIDGVGQIMLERRS